MSEQKPVLQESVDPPLSIEEGRGSKLDKSSFCPEKGLTEGLESRISPFPRSVTSRLKNTLPSLS